MPNKSTTALKTKQSAHQPQNGSVTVRLKGGLGNQLFQYASARALAWDRAANLILDCAWYERKNSNRKLKVDQFPINAQHVSLTKPARLLRKHLSRLSPITIKKMGFTTLGYYITEPSDNGYKPLRNLPGSHLYMDGYWQAIQNFEHYRTQLLAELTPPPSIIESLPKQTSSSVVSVHIRRGDYADSPNAHMVTEQYVQNAMQQFDNNHDFLFFSDDIKWCQQKFKSDRISFATNPSDLHDLAHMSLCAHNIIANSSFSWWSAWLNTNTDKRVIAPQPWTAEDTHKDILPDNWETLPIS